MWLWCRLALGQTHVRRLSKGCPLRPVRTPWNGHAVLGRTLRSQDGRRNGPHRRGADEPHFDSCELRNGRQNFGASTLLKVPNDRALDGLAWQRDVAVPTMWIGSAYKQRAPKVCQFFRCYDTKGVFWKCLEYIPILPTVRGVSGCSSGVKFVCIYKPVIETFFTEVSLGRAWFPLKF